MDNRKYSVVIVDDCPLFRKGAADTLTASNHFQVLGLTGDGKTALSLIGLKPDVVVIDLDAREFQPLNLLKAIKYRQPSCRAVMILGAAGSSSSLMQAIRLDANGYLLRNLSPDEFVEQILVVAQGGMATSEKITTALAEHLRAGAPEDASENIAQLLTRREFEVLRCVASSLSNREIARHLSITDGTVKVHVKHVLKKLKFRSRVEAAVWASNHGYRLDQETLEEIRALPA